MMRLNAFGRSKKRRLGNISAFINHDCNPNAQILEDNKQMVVKIIKTVKEGEELTIDYIGQDSKGIERKNQLKNYGIVCLCSICKTNKQKIKARNLIV
jgi:SET domain-containing protein